MMKKHEKSPKLDDVVFLGFIYQLFSAYYCIYSNDYIVIQVM